MADARYNVLATTPAGTGGLGNTFSAYIDVIKYGVPIGGGLFVLLLCMCCCYRFCKSLLKDPEATKEHYGDYEDEELMKNKSEWDDISIPGMKIDLAIEEELNAKKLERLKNEGGSKAYVIDTDEGIADDASSGDSKSSRSSTPKRQWKRTTSMSESVEMLNLCDQGFGSKDGSTESLDNPKSPKDPAALIRQPLLSQTSNMSSDYMYKPPPLDRGVSYYDDTTSLTSFKLALHDGPIKMTPLLSQRRIVGMNPYESYPGQPYEHETYTVLPCDDTSSLTSFKMALSDGAVKMTPCVERKSMNPDIRTAYTGHKVMETPYNDRRELTRLYSLSDADDTDTECTPKEVHVMAEIHQGRPVVPLKPKPTVPQKPTVPHKPTVPQKLTVVVRPQVAVETQVKVGKRRETNTELIGATGDRIREDENMAAKKDLPALNKAESFNGYLARVDTDNNVITKLATVDVSPRSQRRSRRYSASSDESDHSAKFRVYDSDSEVEDKKVEEPYFPKNLKRKKKDRLGAMAGMELMFYGL